MKITREIEIEPIKLECTFPSNSIIVKLLQKHNGLDEEPKMQYIDMLIDIDDEAKSLLENLKNWVEKQIK